MEFSGNVSDSSCETPAPFYEGGDKLDVHFEKAGRRVVGSIFSAPGNLRMRDYPHSVTFSPQKTLVDRIEQSAGDILYQLPPSYSEKNNYHHLPAEHAKSFFDSLHQLQSEGKGISVSGRSLERMLSKLVKHECVTQQQADGYRSMIHTVVTKKDYESQVKENKDVDGALTLAWYYRDNNNQSRAIDWLCTAKGFYGANIAEKIDLAAFLNPFHVIEEKEVFYPNCPSGVYVGWTVPVRSQLPSWGGLYGIHGNLWEWCNDWYGSYGGDETDPIGPTSGPGRVLRGGCWVQGAEFCRSACRRSETPHNAGHGMGFRPVKSKFAAK